MNEKSSRSRAIRYTDAGVDIDAGNRLVELIRPAVESTKRPGADGTIGGLFNLKAAGFVDPVLVAATDGVGTKLRLAIEIGKYDTIGIDLVAMCVNDLIVQGAKRLFFLDYYATGQLRPEEAASVVEGIAEGCKKAGAALLGGETAEMRGLYSNRDFDLAGFAVGAVERNKLLPRRDIAPGDVILGLTSSGVHSNGFSLVRRLVTDAGLSWSDEAPFAAGTSLGEALLAPTRIYVPAILSALRQTSGVKALAHITGGGLTENVRRILPPSAGAWIDLSAFSKPPVFDWLREAGEVEQAEMLRTFNCGVGMIAIVDAATADDVASVLTGAGTIVAAIGEIKSRQGHKAISYVGGL